MSSVNFIANYIAKCAQEGIQDGKGICNKAKSRLNEINEILKSVDNLRIERLNLIALLKELKDEDFSTENISAENKNLEKLKAKITQLLESEEGLTNRYIINKVGNYQEDFKVIQAIQSLSENEVVTRDRNNKVIKGRRFDFRSVNS